MSKLIKKKIEFRLNNSKVSKIKNIFSLEPIESIIKKKTKKKIINDLSLNYLKNYTLSTYPIKTCVNHNHKKIQINEKIRANNSNKNILNNLSINKRKYNKYPLKLNYKPSKSLKDLLEEEHLLNSNLRAIHTRNNTKIELFSTNTTLSFLNIKDSIKDVSNHNNIKTKNDNRNNKNNKNNKKFSATFIEKKIRQYIRSHSKNKIKYTKNELSHVKNNKNNKIKKKKSHDFCLSYVKNINKNKNSSNTIKENENTNSLKELYNTKIKRKNTHSTNLLLDNKSFSLNNNQINKSNISKYNSKSKNKIIKKGTNLNYQSYSINNKKKYNLSSLPNLLCNINFNDKKKDAIKYKNRNSYQNLLEHKKNNKNFHKIKIIDNKKLRNLFKNFKNIHKGEKMIKISKSEEKIYTNQKIENNMNNNYIENKLKTIENGVKSLLNGFYSIYLNSKVNNTLNKISNIN